MKIDDRTIVLDGNEIATAIEAYLIAHDVIVDGSRNISLGLGHLGGREALIVGEFSARIYVNQSSRAIHRGVAVIDRRPDHKPEGSSS